jgi:hypothetical protein
MHGQYAVPVEGGVVELRLRDYVRREINPQTGWAFWAVDLSMLPATRRLKAVVFVLRSYRLGLPKLASGFGALGTVAGVSAVTVWALLKNVSTADLMLIVLAAALLILIFGAALLWNDTEADKGILGGYVLQLQAAEVARTDYAALRHVIGQIHVVGIDLLAAAEEVGYSDDEERIAQVDDAMANWVEQLRGFAVAALGMGESAMLLGRIPLGMAPAEQVSAGVGYLDELLYSRLAMLDVQSGFDAQAWLKGFEEADEEGGQDTDPESGNQL